MIPLFLILAALGLGLEPVIQGVTFNGASVLAIVLLGGGFGVQETEKSVSYTELERPTFGHRWLFRLDAPVRYSHEDGVEYVDGESSTEFVIVSWGRDGDTCIFPATSEGRIEDLLGYKSWDFWLDADEAMSEWLAP